MEFFDKKQEVLEVKLTPFGRYKLSRGRFKPTHYAFFDEGIIYNSVLTGGDGEGFVEAQNKIEGRIQEDTPSLKSLNVRTGIQSAQSASAAIIRSIFEESGSTLLDDPLFMDPGAIYSREELQYPGDKAAFMTRPLGSSRLNSDKYAAWQMSFFQGEISSSNATMQGGFFGGIERIPQVNVQLKYNTYTEEATGISTINQQAPGVSLLSDGVFTEAQTTHNLQSVTTEILGDKYIVVDRKDAILQLEEHNVSFFKENYDIEVFLSGSEYFGGLKQLKFNRDIDAVYTPEDVEYYLTIRTDNEIDSSTLTRLGIRDFTALGSATGSGVVSTRDYFIKDLYQPEEDLCD